NRCLKIATTDQPIFSPTSSGRLSVAITLIQGLSVTFDADRQNDESEECDLPKLEANIDDAVAFQENAADDAEKMSERKTLSDHLGPTRHSPKWKHETGK